MDATVPHIERYKELSVKELWPHVKSNRYLNRYFPTYSPTKCPNKDYFFTILVSIIPREFGEMLNEIKKQKEKVRNDS